MEYVAEEGIIYTLYKYHEGAQRMLLVRGYNTVELEQQDGERVCQEEDGGAQGSTFCSTEGFCVRFTNSASSDANVERFPPKIELRGALDRVSIDVRTAYEICPTNLAASDSELLCEEGAVAADTIETTSGNKTSDISFLIQTKCQFTPAVTGEVSPGH
eukprot:scaffold258974_cov17-Tisochrysis_lutea.AAC.1